MKLQKSFRAAFRLLASRSISIEDNESQEPVSTRKFIPISENLPPGGSDFDVTFGGAVNAEDGRAILALSPPARFTDASASSSIITREIRQMKSLLNHAGIIMLALLLSGCSGIYYSFQESLGKEKRDILSNRVQAAREDTQEAKEQFQSAYEEFAALINFEGTDLDQAYRSLKQEYERCVDRANDVRERIDSIEDVGEVLFEEWEDELDEYQSREFRRISERRMRETREKYEDFLAAMRRAEEKMDPVLEAFQDHVLFLKHHLNAQMIGQMAGELSQLQVNIGALIEDMEHSISEANDLIGDLESPG